MNRTNIKGIFLHALFEGIDPGIIVALGFIFEEFPELAGTAVEVPNHAWFFRWFFTSGKLEKYLDGLNAT